MKNVDAINNWCLWQIGAEIWAGISYMGGSLVSVRRRISAWWSANLGGRKSACTLRKGEIVFSSNAFIFSLFVLQCRLSIRCRCPTSGRTMIVVLRSPSPQLPRLLSIDSVGRAPSLHELHEKFNTIQMQKSSIASHTPMPRPNPILKSIIQSKRLMLSGYFIRRPSPPPCQNGRNQGSPPPRSPSYSPAPNHA